MDKKFMKIVLEVLLILLGSSIMQLSMDKNSSLYRIRALRFVMLSDKLTDNTIELLNEIRKEIGETGEQV